MKLITKIAVGALAAIGIGAVAKRSINKKVERAKTLAYNEGVIATLAAHGDTLKIVTNVVHTEPAVIMVNDLSSKADRERRSELMFPDEIQEITKLADKWARKETIGAMKRRGLKGHIEVAVKIDYRTKDS